MGPREASPRSSLACRWAGILWIVLLLVFPEFLVATVRAKQNRPTESQIEAIYLFNFSRFIQWPAHAAAGTSDFPVCILGEDPFGTFLDETLAGETVAGKKIIAKRISTSQDALGCRIVFVSTSEQDHLKELFEVLDHKSVLTVSDIPEFADQGGMIEFVVRKNKVRFEINLTSATDAGLTLSSDLLKVAVSVRKDAHGGA